MWSYTAYGLDIQSAIALPELLASEPHDSAVPASATADVVVRFGRTDEYCGSIPQDSDLHAEATEKEAILYWRSVGTFQVREGKEIVVYPAAEADLEAIRLFLLGSVMGILLHQRGHLALHASAVALHGGVCLFAGASGWGKSTMGAILNARGHRVVADDISLIDGGVLSPFTVTPAFPRMKLWPESLKALGQDPDALPALRNGLEKRSFAVRDTFATTTLPLKRIYILSRGDSTGIDPLAPVSALLELVTHSYGARLLRHVHTASHFQRYSRIASTIPVRRLTRRWSLDDLPALAQAVEEDVLQ